MAKSDHNIKCYCCQSVTSIAPDETVDSTIGTQNRYMDLVLGFQDSNSDLITLEVELADTKEENFSIMPENESLKREIEDLRQQRDNLEINLGNLMKQQNFEAEEERA